MIDGIDAQTILESIGEGFYAVDGAWRVVYMNREAERILGKRREEVVGRNLLTIFGEVDPDKSEGYRLHLRAAQERKPLRHEFRSRLLQRWLEVNINPAADGLYVYFRDIENRKRTEQALRESEERLRSAVEATAVGTWDFDPVTGQRAWSDQFKALLGLPQGVQPSAELFFSVVHPDDRALAIRRYRRALDPSRGGQHRLVMRIRRPNDGAERWIEMRGRVSFHVGRPVRAVGTLVDITERKRSEEELRRLNDTLEERVAERSRELEAAAARQRRSDERYAVLFEASPSALFLIDVEPGGRFVYEDANAAFYRMTGLTPGRILGRSPVDLFPGELADFLIEKFRLCATTGERVEYEISGALPAGYLIRRVFLVPLHDAGRVAKIFATEIDLTAARRLQEALHQAQKMEAVGQLTGGIAHDFNNLLTAIGGNLELLEGRLKDEALARLARAAIRSAERGAKLTGQLLAFSRKQHLQPRPLDVNELISGMEEMLVRTIGTSARIRTALGAGLWPALADPNQLELVILNLAINGRDAMPHGGDLVIETRNATLEHGTHSGGQRAGDYVLVVVTDTGTGMPPEVQRRAFEPFFTTKEAGKGSGLGLSMVYGVISQLGGGVRLSSEPGKGTRVELYLPRAEPAEAPEPAESAPAQTARLQGRVLLVEDDAEVRQLAVGCLREAGYEVAEAANGQAGLEAIERDPDIDLLVADLAMPGITGPALARQARDLRPALKVMFATGYAENDAADLGDAVILRKPFSLSELVDQVAMALAGEPGSVEH